MLSLNSSQSSLEPVEIMKEVGSIQNKGFVVGVKEVNRNNESFLLVTAISANIFDHSWVKLRSMAKILNSDITLAFDSNVVETFKSLLHHYESVRYTIMVSSGGDSIYRAKCMAISPASFENHRSQLCISIIECSNQNMYLFEIEEIELPSNFERNGMLEPRKCQILFSNNIINRINRSKSSDEVTKMFCDAAMEILSESERAITVKFMTDGSGIVCNETIRDSLKDAAQRVCGSILPTDVFKEPENYRRNKWQFVYDVDDCETAVYSLEDDPLDLSMTKFVTLTAPAKSWLRSLGVRSVLAIVIEVNGNAWGLFAIHSIGRLMVPTHEQCVLLESIASTSAIKLESIAREDHFAHMAHEIRTPLHSIVSALQILQLDAMNWDATQSVSTIDCADIIDCAVKSSEVMMGILNCSLLNHAQADRKSTIMPIKLQNLLSSVVRLLRPIAKHKSLAIDLVAGNVFNTVLPELIILGEESRIVQIANNFVSNAIKFTPQKGSVTVRASYLPRRHVDTLWNSRKYQYRGSYNSCRCNHINHKSQGPTNLWVVLEVEDTGCGVSDANMQIMFKPYERLSGVGENYSTLQGDGLGLHIVKMHIEAMGGMLCVASTVGSGTLLFCAFPANQADSVIDVSSCIGTTNSDAFVMRSKPPSFNSFNSIRDIPVTHINRTSIPNSESIEPVKCSKRARPPSTTSCSKSRQDSGISINQSVASMPSQCIFEVGVIQNHGFVVGLKIYDAEDIRVVAVNQEILQCSWVNLKTLDSLLNSEISLAFHAAVVTGLKRLLFQHKSLNDDKNVSISPETGIDAANINLRESRNLLPQENIIMRTDLTFYFEDLHLSLSIVNCSTPDIRLFEIEHIVELEVQTHHKLINPLSVTRGLISNIIDHDRKTKKKECWDLHSQRKNYQVDIFPGNSNSTKPETASMLHITGIFCDTVMEMLSGCDRAWTFRMLSDGSGEVVNERIRDDVRSFTFSQLGQKYPSNIFNDSELYLSSGYRINYDIETPHSTVFAYNLESLDLRKCKLCTITEACLSAYQKMNIRSSLVIPIQVDGRLWGLYVMHSMNRPMLPSYEQCVLLEAVATNSALRIASITREEFVSHMSHELRTPLHGITSALHILQSDSSVVSLEDRLVNIKRALQSGEAMVTTISDILTISRGTHRNDKVIRSFDIHNTISSVTQVFETIACEKLIRFEKLIVVDRTIRFRKFEGINATHQYTSLIDFNIMGDITRKSKTLHNLLDNAIKFTPAEGSVNLRVSCVSADRAKEIWADAAKCYESNYIASTLDHSHITLSVSPWWLTFEVKDTGCGIAGHSMKIMYDAYQQLSCGINNCYQGIGLGLHTARLHTDIMGGVLGAASTLEVGSLFYCAFPVQIVSTFEMIDDVRVEDHISCRLAKKPAIIDTGEAFDANKFSAIITCAPEIAALPNISVQAISLGFESLSQITKLPFQQLGNSSNFNFEESKNNMSQSSTNTWRVTNEDTLGNNCTSTITRPEAIFLAVDDSPFNLKLLLRKIELTFDKGANVTIECLSAANGSIAVDTYKALIDDGRHHLLAGIFMDYHMPVCNGAETIKMIRAIERSMCLRHVHIIAFTADFAEVSYKNLLESGADDVMPKPTPFGHVENICRRLVQSLRNNI